MKTLSVRRSEAGVTLERDGEAMSESQVVEALEDVSLSLRSILQAALAQKADLVLPVTFVASLLLAEFQGVDLTVDWDGEETIPFHRLPYEIRAYVKVHFIPAVRDGDFSSEKEQCTMFVHWLCDYGWMEQEELFETLNCLTRRQDA